MVQKAQEWRRRSLRLNQTITYFKYIVDVADVGVHGAHGHLSEDNAGGTHVDGRSVRLQLLALFLQKDVRGDLGRKRLPRARRSVSKTGSSYQVWSHPDLRHFLRRKRAREAEVGQLRRAISVEENVVGLHVAMHAVVAKQETVYGSSKYDI